MGFVYPFNLREIGNGVALWLGIEPYELFFYIFLPPLLLDAALKIDWYVFKKVNVTCAQSYYISHFMDCPMRSYPLEAHSALPNGLFRGASCKAC